MVNISQNAHIPVGFAFWEILTIYNLILPDGFWKDTVKTEDKKNMIQEQKEEIRKSLEEADESPETKACKANWEIVKEYQRELEDLFKEE